MSSSVFKAPCTVGSNCHESANHGSSVIISEGFFVSVKIVFLFSNRLLKNCVEDSLVL